MTSIFTKIINNEIPAYRVYEDDLCIAFLDISPQKKGHTLLIPKQEIERYWQLDEATSNHLAKITKKLMKQMIDTLGVDYVEVRIEGIEVPHIHIHLIPRLLLPQKEGITYEEGEAQRIAHKIAGKTD